MIYEALKIRLARIYLFNKYIILNNGQISSNSSSPGWLAPFFMVLDFLAGKLYIEVDGRSPSANAKLEDRSFGPGQETPNPNRGRCVIASKTSSDLTNF